MRFYLANGQYVGTQADARKLDRAFTPVDVPTDKDGLMAYLNRIAGVQIETDDLSEETFAEVVEQPVPSIRERVDAMFAPREPSKVQQFIEKNDVDRIADWIMDETDQRGIERLFEALGARIGELRKRWHDPQPLEPRTPDRVRVLDIQPGRRARDGGADPMSETRFTPGPWSAHCCDVQPDGDDDGRRFWDIMAGEVHRSPDERYLSGYIACPNQNMAIGSVQFPKDIERRDANAHLIAAAPELYEALTDIEWSGLEDREEGGYERSCPFCSSTSDLGHNDACKVAAALAKARGEA